MNWGSRQRQLSDPRGNPLFKQETPLTTLTSDFVRSSQSRKKSHFEASPSKRRTGPVVLTAKDSEAYHKKAMAEIVHMIRDRSAGYGKRNFDIGKRALEYAQWQRDRVPDQKAFDFDALMNRLKNEINRNVTIKPSSVHLGSLVRGYILRERIREAIGDGADLFLMTELIAIQWRALEINKADVTGEIVSGWVEFFRSVASDRANGLGVSVREFKKLFEAHTETLSLAVSTYPPNPSKPSSEPPSSKLPSVKAHPHPASAAIATYEDDERDFLMAVDQFKLRTGRRFPTLADHLAILKSLGFSRMASGRPAPSLCTEGR